MENILFTIFITIATATILNIIFRFYNISHIVGYIFTGTIISYIFNFNGSNFNSLNMIGEFGIVFLMFTIGLELNFEKIKKMKEDLFVNGFLQVVTSVVTIFIIAKYIFELDNNTSLIIALAFSLSSTAIVLTYLKESKDAVTPYGSKSLGILIFQDLAVIPILLLITYLTNDTSSIHEVLIKTFLSAFIVLIFMFTAGKKIVDWLLRFSAKSRLEELFLGSVLSIVLGAAILAHGTGFTYSLGAFIAGMIIADTKYNMKVESDIQTYKDVLLGTFFFSVGMKIDVIYLFSKIHIVFAIFAIVIVFKIILIYLIIRRNTDKSTAIKTALALGQISEFAFAIFAIAEQNKIISSEIAGFLILVTVASIVVTPFILNNIYKLSSFFVVEFYESDKITPIKSQNHIVIVGFSILGRLIAQDLKESNIPFVIISDNLKHVLLARKLGFMGYFGHLDKKPVLESLQVDKASSVILTVSNPKRKLLISEAVSAFAPNSQIIIPIESVDEKKTLKNIGEFHFIDPHKELAKLMTNEAKNINQNKSAKS